MPVRVVEDGPGLWCGRGRARYREGMTEVRFYHLERQPLEAVLPGLLERSLERGWRVVVQAGSEERVAALDAHLWTYRDDSFLPHGSGRDGNPALQPVWLTAGDDTPNRATVRFLLDGAEAAEPAGFDLLVHLFDGRDPAALEGARAAWRAAKAAGHEVTYWQQTEAGRWERKA